MPKRIKSMVLEQIAEAAKQSSDTQLQLSAKRNTEKQKTHATLTE